MTFRKRSQFSVCLPMMLLAKLDDLQRLRIVLVMGLYVFRAPTNGAHVGSHQFSIADSVAHCGSGGLLFRIALLPVFLRPSTDFLSNCTRSVFLSSPQPMRKLVAFFFVCLILPGFVAAVLFNIFFRALLALPRRPSAI